MDKLILSERDIFTKCITPAIQLAGWQQHEFREEVQLTDGRVMVRGNLAARIKNPEVKGGPKRADYVLYARPAFNFTIMDFKGATRLFADPDFDGEPVVIYEPKPGEPVVPPDNLLPPNTIGDLDSPNYGAPAGEPEDDEDGGTTCGGAGRTKYVLDDVNVRIAVERSKYLDADGHLITEDYRVLLKDDIKKSLQTQFGSLTDFLRRWSEAERKQAILDELKVQGVPLEVLQLAVANSKELDVFDLVAHIAFDQKPLTCRDRVNNAKKRDVFAKYGEQARTVLEVLLEKFADHGIGDIEDPKVLELPPFDQIGTKTQIRRGIFGSNENYAQAASDLEHALYDELPFEKRA